MRKIHILIVLLFLLSNTTCSLAGQDDDTFGALVNQHKISLENAHSLDTIVAMAAGRRVVLLGEASHGTSEFYAWRDSISRRLIAGEGFRFVLVEGDWASLFQLNRYVKGKSSLGSAKEVVQQFDRWPTWMWRNKEVVALAEWMRDYNRNRPAHLMAGFYGMDVYDEWNSYDEIMAFLAEYDPDLHRTINDYYNCMAVFDRDSWQYAGATARGYESCAPKLRQAFNHLEHTLSADEEMHPYDVLFVLQNARVLKNAERFYRKAVSDRAKSWNSRVEHMFHTLLSLLNFHGEEAKAIVWAHNTHIGDARQTDMSLQNQVNSGQLAREYFGEDTVLLVGFGTYTGTVTAGRQWGANMLTLPLPDAMEGSIEQKLHSAAPGDFLLVMNPELRQHAYFSSPIGHRAAGVVYNPEHEQPGNYVPSIVGRRYDVFIFIEKTNHLRFVD